MAQDPDVERIRQKAHELWEAEGRPHGRDQDHWDQAREIIAIEDSQALTLLPRTTGAGEPEEPSLAVDSLGDIPGLTDQGKDDLTDTSREFGGFSAASTGAATPSTRPGMPKAAAAKAPEKAMAAAKPSSAKPAPAKPAPAKPAVVASASPAAVSSGPIPSKPAAKPQRAPK